MTAYRNPRSRSTTARPHEAAVRRGFAALGLSMIDPYSDAPLTEAEAAAWDAAVERSRRLNEAYARRPLLIPMPAKKS